MEPEFQPFKLELTVSTLEQARALYAIFNHTDNGALLHEAFKIPYALVHHVGDKVYVSRRKDVIARGVTYEEFYK